MERALTGSLPAGHPPVPAPRVGVLLINLGTPDAPERGAVRRYLAEFLSDRRVVELPPLLWQPLLRGVILNTRPAKSAAAYREIWTPQGSPLAVITASIAEKLGAMLPGVIVDWAMRYGTPSIADRLRAMHAAGAQRILLAPLYPQYAGSTTATAVDAAYAALAGMRWQPALRTLPPYYDDPSYIDALAEQVRGAELPFEADTLLASFHSVPLRTLEQGDPYHCHARKTARLLGEALGREVGVSFQSKLGRAKWLEPSTEETLRTLGEQGRRVLVITPGFSVDNLETLEEIAIRGRETFIEAGGRDFAVLPCLNDSAGGIAMLSAIVSRELAGWTPTP